MINGTAGIRLIYFGRKCRWDGISLNYIEDLVEDVNNLSTNGTFNNIKSAIKNMLAAG